MGNPVRQTVKKDTKRSKQMQADIDRQIEEFMKPDFSKLSAAIDESRPKQEEFVKSSRHRDWMEAKEEAGRYEYEAEKLYGKDALDKKYRGLYGIEKSKRTYKLDNGAIFKVTKTEYGTPTKIVLEQDGKKYVLSAGMDKYPGGNSLNARQSMALRLDTIFNEARNGYDTSDLESKLVDAFKKEYQRTQPAREGYTKEYLEIESKREECYAKAAEVKKKVKALEAEGGDKPYTTKEDEEKYLASKTKNSGLTRNPVASKGREAGD